MGQTIVFLHHRQYCLCARSSQFPFQPVFQMRGHSFRGNSFYIPGHIHKQLYLILGRLDISDVQYPHLLYASIVSQLHLLENQIRTHRTQPEMVVRTSPIRNMIIDSIPSFTCAFFGRRKMADIAIVIVTPHQCYIIGHL